MKRSIKETMEIRKPIDERRNTAKGDRHQLRELSKRIKQCFWDTTRTKRREQSSGFCRNSEASKVHIMHKKTRNKEYYGFHFDDLFQR